MLNFYLKSCVLIFLFGIGSITEVDSILGGSYAAEHQYPYTVSIRLNGKHICGGALITHRHVLTAARCVDRKIPKENYKIMLGTYKLSGKNGIFVPIQDIDYPYDYTFVGKPDLTDDLVPNDLVVLTMKDVVPKLVQFSPLGLNRKNMAELRHAQCVFTGWGQYKYRSLKNPFSDILKVLNVTFTDQNFCSEMVAGVWSMDSSQLCIMSERMIPNVGYAGPNYGDTGGPLVCEGSLVGILSTWTSPKSDLPDVYARVLFLSNFVGGILRKKLPETQQLTKILEKKLKKNSDFKILYPDRE